MSIRDIHLAEMKRQLDELTAAIDELEINAHETNVELVRDKYKAEISKLRYQSQLAIDKLGQFKADGEGFGKYRMHARKMYAVPVAILFDSLNRNCKPGALAHGQFIH